VERGEEGGKNFIKIFFLLQPASGGKGWKKINMKKKFLPEKK
jgi:hypothetical protein